MQTVSNNEYIMMKVREQNEIFTICHLMQNMLFFCHKGYSVDLVAFKYVL